MYFSERHNEVEKCTGFMAKSFSALLWGCPLVSVFLYVAIDRLYHAHTAQTVAREEFHFLKSLFCLFIFVLFVLLCCPKVKYIRYQISDGV